MPAARAQDEVREWRVDGVTRFGALAVGVGLLMLVVAVTIGPSPGTGVVVTLWAIAAAFGGWAWRWTVYPSIRLDSSTVRVRNALATYECPLSEVADVEPTGFGLRLVLKDGHRVTAWAVQKARGDIWTGRRARADDVADAIRRRAGLA